MVCQTSKSLPTDNATVAEQCLKFVTDDLLRYSRAEQHCQRTMLHLLNGLFGETPVCEFGLLRLRVVRQAIMDGDPTAKPMPRMPHDQAGMLRVRTTRRLFDEDSPTVRRTNCVQRRPGSSPRIDQATENEDHSR